MIFGKNDWNYVNNHGIVMATYNSADTIFEIGDSIESNKLLAGQSLEERRFLRPSRIYDPRIRCILIIIIAVSIVVSIQKIFNPFTISYRNVDISSSFLMKPDISLIRVGYEDIMKTSFSDTSYLKYNILRNNSIIIEPHVDMKLYITNPTKLNKHITYTFEICRISDNIHSNCLIGKFNENLIEEERVWSSHMINLQCRPHDLYTLTLLIHIQTPNSVELLAQYFYSAICMYVRREVRDLTPAHRYDLLETMHVLWKTREEEGQMKYGQYFHNATFFTNWHHFNAAWIDADHLHEGIGFLIQHVKLTNAFELALQSINPSISLPYWDFTIEGANSIKIQDSPIFTSSFFGSMPVPRNTSLGFIHTKDRVIDAAIPNGRWAYLKVNHDTHSGALHHPYGYLRSPWNLNPSPFISRFTPIAWSVATCQEYSNLLQKTGFADFMSAMPYRPHGSTHVAIGGLYGCDLFLPLLELGGITDITALNEICVRWGFQMKKMYRTGLLLPPTSCISSVETDYGVDWNCRFQCTAELNDVVNSLSLFELAPFLPVNMSTDALAAWYDFICFGNGSYIFSGDHVESASPYDPSFWVIHPTLERAYHAKMLSGGFEDNSWPTSAASVCERSICDTTNIEIENNIDESTTAASATVTTSIPSSATEEGNNGCCYGHYLEDQVFDFTTWNRNHGWGLTNKEVLDAIDASSESYSSPYIYDSFRWSHCEKESIDLEELLYSLYEKYIL